MKKSNKKSSAGAGGLRIGYVGTLDPSGTCYSRLVALQKLEASVYPFDTDEFLNVHKLSRLSRWLEWVPYCGFRGRKLNQELLRFARRSELDLVWIDKGTWIKTATLKQMRGDGIRLVHHLTDALWPKSLRLRASRYPLLARGPAYHWTLTSNREDYKKLQTKLPGRVILTQLGYDDGRFNDLPINDKQIIDKWSHDLVFVGHHEPRTERMVLALVKAGLNVKVFGDGWERRIPLEPCLRGIAAGRISNQEYVWALKLAKIGLGLISEVNYNQTSGRSYENPACGTFLLAMRTEEHREHYREGYEAEFFDREEELVGKAKRYLADNLARQRVASNGRIRCLTSGYSWREIMARDWKIIRSELGSESGAAA